MGMVQWGSGLCVLTVLCAACLRPGSQQPDVGIGPVAAAIDFSVVALPVYRLVASPGLLDTPSRLLAVQVRIEGSGSASYAFEPDDLTIALPDGSQARIFDRPRAIGLLRRAQLANADMSYLLGADYRPGGLGNFSAGTLSTMVQQNLLGPGTFGPGQPLQGYVIIDTGQPMVTLDGASFAVIAHRVGDDAPARYAYQLATVPNPSTGTP